MGGFSMWHWIVLLLCVGWAIAAGTILKRLGFSAWWGVLAFFPLFNLVGIWFVALAPWPIEERAGRPDRD